MPKLPPKKQQPRQQKQYSSNVGNFYSSMAWIKLSSKHLRENPLCVDCLKLGILTDCNKKEPIQRNGKTILMRIGRIDHITPLIEGGAALDQANLQTLCKSCHAINLSYAN
jgi:5-methylcytosine-specific restriction endonuclease McrA